MGSMENLFIVPMRPLQFREGMDTLNSGKAYGNTGAEMFKDLFQTLVSEAADAEASFERQKLLLATGQIEDAHTVTIAGSYAQLSVDMLVSMRNKALESYNELMRLNI